ncbi:MAG: 23S rRNA (pseudouridine(1915)-N(3))-methyltransferase RlmH [Patescibacteria group bacterium]|jgi:23S rRNA (pseudouridine1915-N3)-methyltransferase|nr:23S rRNA (pseudouridine(1915)-N(3))-methyltransferase RlmH [Patescibacteria group bacterium]
MKITIITIGKVKESYLKEGILEYKKRLGPYSKIKEIELKAESFSAGSREKTKVLEGERVLNALGKHEKENVFLLDENAQEYSSLNFSKILDSKNEVVFVIAGSLGWSDGLRNSVYKKISLSKMTFPHEIARLLLFEQIYRGITIINGKEYHY